MMKQDSFVLLRISDKHRANGGFYTSRLLYYFRRCQTVQNPILSLIWRALFKLCKDRRMIEIYGKCKIGPGLYLGHAYCITINPDAVIGANCNIHKGGDNWARK